VFRQFIVGLLIASFLAFPLTGTNEEVQARVEFCPTGALPIGGWADLYNGGIPLVIMDDRTGNAGIKAESTAADILADPEAAAATFAITYIAAGGTDLIGEPCYDFPRRKDCLQCCRASGRADSNHRLPDHDQGMLADLGSSSGVSAIQAGGPRIAISGGTKRQTPGTTVRWPTRWLAQT